ncbi:universal stress protein [Desulfomonile tiedjei]|uniref:Universal stress protein n=1 Tax=Desulfomonile tiedjei (strain ATCC 49306 / DSM 6799 / DCB-1) TaxID=706587 RepID=I4CED7_DESTA|nr:universal stress protein [Desulfomonile tiedjei]AFM27928.1 universal stress protein UspA-like protein [Desulfomonile tiedjei DSM 6799]
MLTPNRILYCSDFSENSERAGRIALSYARTFEADLLVVNVINIRFLQHPALIGLPVYGDAVDSVEKRAEEQLREISERFKRQMPAVQTFSRKGIPGEEILKLAEEQSVDLIIMGTHGRTGLSHLLVGSTAEHVVRMAKCPVLTVKSQD